ncbi:MotE family protein [Marivita sp.]|uniref:MotE family protein n=1 Tax=Marivita sp. TaxID=2003365 RepID=UPI003F6CF375
MTKKSKKAEATGGPSRKGTLAIIGTFLLLSAGVRLATEAGQVIASEDPKATLSEQVSEQPTMDLARPETLNAAFEAIKEREQRLIDRETEMDQRETSVAAAETAIEAELAKLEQAEQNLRETISLASAAAEDDLSQLTDVYANMKPKQAAALFEQMEAAFAAGFLARMPTDSAARIMAGMTPEKAYEISVRLAGRNANIPLQ